MIEEIPPRLSEEAEWYTEHTALLISTMKWALLGTGAGLCVGLGTRVFLWTVAASTSQAASLTHGRFASYWLLPVAMPLCVWLIRTFAPDARGHGTEAVIAAIHTRSGRIDWLIAPVKLAGTVLTLAAGGSVGKEGPAAQIGAAITSLFADIARLDDEDRRRLVICGISAGFAAVFGTPVSGALFGIEVLYLGRLDYTVIFPAMVAGIVGHLACGAAPPFPPLHETLGSIGDVRLLLTTIAAGALFGVVALLLIETLRAVEHVVERLHMNAFLLAALGGCALVVLYSTAGPMYAGLGTDTIDGVLAGAITVSGGVFLLKILATAITLETGGSGGILTPIFFIGVTSGAAMARLFHVSPTLMAAFGFVSVLAAAANTPIAAAVMAIELLPPGISVYAALAAATAYLMVGHRSVYASQKLGFSKSALLDLPLGGAIGDVERSAVRFRKPGVAERLHTRARHTDREAGDAP